MRVADRAGHWAAVFLGLSIPVSVALDNLLLLLALSGWLAGGCYTEKWKAVRNNAVLQWALALFGLLLIGTLWADPASEQWAYLLKYADLAFIPVFAYFFRDPDTRRLALMMFAGSMTLVLVLSLMVKLGVLTGGSVIRGSTWSPVVFKLRITHNLFMAYAAFLFAWLAVSGQPGTIRAIWGLLALLAAANVTLMVEGATGYVVLTTLALLLAFSLLRRRDAYLCLAATPLLLAAMMLIPSPFAQRVTTLSQEIQAWRPDVAATVESSSGQRLEFYTNSLRIIADHPVIGVGTGGFPSAYAEQARGSAMAATRNPHNEYLHIAVQVGLLGVAAMLALFASQWHAARRLPTRIETNLARGLVLVMAIGCLFNSFLLDHAEGLFFAWMSGLLYGGLGPSTAGQTAT